MNPVFNNYMANLGQRFADYSIKDPCSVDYENSGDKLKLIATKLETGVENKDFYEIDKHGFLVKKPSEILSNILPEHGQFVENFGVIIDQYGYENKYIQNLVEIFCCDTNSQNMDLIIEDFQEKCRKANVTTSCNDSLFRELIIFAYEANGNCYFYDSEGQVFFYGMDHAYTGLTLMSGYPEYTFYKISTLPDLNSFVFTLLRDKEEKGE